MHLTMIKRLSCDLSELSLRVSLVVECFTIFNMHWGYFRIEINSFYTGEPAYGPGGGGVPHWEDNNKGT